MALYALGLQEICAYDPTIQVPARIETSVMEKRRVGLMGRGARNVMKGHEIKDMKKIWRGLAG